MKQSCQDANVGANSDNVIAFPGTYRRRPTASSPARDVRQLPPTTSRAVALSGAELNVRLLVLLGVCTTSCVIVLSAIHVLHG